MIPRESGLRLYKRLVLDEVENNRHQIRHFVRSSERERLRTLSILGLLPSDNKTSTCDTPSNQKKLKTQKKSKTSSKFSVDALNKIQQSSPYIKKNIETKQKISKKKKKANLLIQSPFRLLQEEKEKSNRVAIPDDYIWHPVFEDNTKITDIMGYYSRQYHKQNLKK